MQSTVIRSEEKVAAYGSPGEGDARRSPDADYNDFALIGRQKLLVPC